jgi:transposase
MANRLKMDIQKAIEGLKRQGWSERKIALELGIHRKTVRGYASGAKCTKVLTGDEGSSRSLCDGFREEIEAKLELGLDALRIHQDLKLEHGFEGAYDTVQRFVKNLKAVTPHRVWRMECEPGQEAQVDFGVLPLLDNGTGKLKRVNLFRIMLSHSRKSYSEAVLTQNSESFLRCLENAFRYFGGVPQRLCVDNLKAAVVKAHWYDPDLNPKIMNFGEHYDIAIMPTRPYTPEHKGKIENGIKYLKNNALKGRRFESIAAINAFLLDWEKNTADKRIHGTTRKQVGSHFEQEEKAHLKALPNSLFESFSEGKRRVHRDSYVEVQRAYYDVPCEYIGQELWVRWDARMIRIYDRNMNLIRSHCRLEPGHFTQVLGVEGCRGSLEQSLYYWRSRVGGIGEGASLWADALIENRPEMAMRILQGLLSKRKKHSKHQIDEACKKALFNGQFRLREIEQLLHGKSEQQRLEFISEHELIRSADSYEQVFATKELF